MTALLEEQHIGRVGRSEEVAAAGPCSLAASFVFGVALPVDGGFAIH